MSSQDISTVLAVTSTNEKKKNGKEEEEEQNPLPRPTTATNPTSSRLNVEKRKPRQKPGEEWKKSEVHEIPH
ncbi:hypothetical protein FRC18_006182, partial [Serendipita sp. 400]